MFRLIVVDDEVAITDWIYQLLNDHYGSKLEIYKAYSSSECLRLMERGSFQIVLTDINMPGMNGIALLTSIAQIYPKTKRIILSAYDNFHYAKKAIELGTVAYVLKDENDDAIIEAVDKAIDELERDLEFLKLSETLKPKTEHLYLCAKNDILMKLLFGREGRTASLDVIESELDFTREMHLSVATFEFSNHGDYHQLMPALKGSLAECLPGYYRYEMIETASNELALLLQTAQSVDGRNDICIPKTPFSAYENAQNVFLTVTGKYFNLFYTSQNCSTDTISASFYRLKEKLERYRNFSCSVILADNVGAEENSSKESGKSLSTEILRAIKYIDQNLDKDLSLISLSEQVYLNPSYFSFVFKQQFGVNVSDYIRTEKIKLCKMLLKDPGYKIHEIARRVGYDNPSYFTRFFKKTTGLTPQEYRQQYITE